MKTHFASRFVAASLLLGTLPLLGSGCGTDEASSADAAISNSDAGRLPDTGTEDEPDAAAARHDASRADAASPTDASSATDASMPNPDAAAADAAALPADAALPGDDAGATCPRLPLAADRARKVILAHPYDTNGDKANVWDVLDLSQAGVVSQPVPRVSFAMGRATEGEVVFTPDGELGFVVQEDGTLGEFRLDAAGQPTVLEAGFSDGIYAGRIVMDPTGQRLFVVDENWPNNGGGISSVRIGCDGKLTTEGKLFSSKLAYAMALLPARPGEAFVFGKEILTAAAGTNAHLMTWGAAPALEASVAAFPDDDAIVPDARVTADGRWALIVDNNSFSGTGERLAVVELQAKTVRAVQVLTGFHDPGQIVPSPYGNAALLVEVQGNAFKVLSLDAANTAAPFALKGAVSYAGAKPQLPTVAVLMDRGSLTGRVLVAELAGVRQVQFQTDGTVTDLGLTEILADMESITGALGVQP